MSEKKGVHKENALLQRGIFTTTDFASFQKSEVVVGEMDYMKELKHLKIFMKICVESVKGKPISSQTEVPPVQVVCLFYR